MELRNKIWYELIDAKFGEQYLAMYISKHKKFRKNIKIITLIFSGGGVLGWTLWQYIPVIACIVVSIIQLLTLIENEIFRSEKEIEELCNLRSMYVAYFTKLDKLWYEINNNVEEQKVSKMYFNLKKNEYSKIENLDNKLYIRTVKSLYDKTQNKVTDFLNNYN